MSSTLADGELLSSFIIVSIDLLILKHFFNALSTMISSVYFLPDI